MEMLPLVRGRAGSDRCVKLCLYMRHHAFTNMR
jgi:hypothetical protein